MGNLRVVGEGLSLYFSEKELSSPPPLPFPPTPVHRAAMWKWLGKLTDQQRSLIEERLKYTDKELAKQGLKPGFR